LQVRVPTSKIAKDPAVSPTCQHTSNSNHINFVYFLVDSSSISSPNNTSAALLLLQQATMDIKTTASSSSLNRNSMGVTGPELRGANITLGTILRPTDVSTRQTKIVCTLGPACWEIPQLEELIDAGMAVARFNFSHGDHEGHKACLDRLRQAAQNKNKHIGACG
jgi:hypothetical protein